MSQPLSALGVFVDSSVAGLHNLLCWFLISCLLGSLGLGNNSRMDLLIELFTGLCLSGSEALLPSGELPGEFLWVLLLELVHVDGDVVAEDVVSKDLSIELSLTLLSVDGLTSLVLNFLDLRSSISWESLGAVWAVDSSIAGTLHDGEDSGTGGSWRKTNIKEGLEWSLFTLHIIG